MSFSWKTFDNEQDDDLVRAVARQESQTRMGLDVAQAFDRQHAAQVDEGIKRDTLENNAEYRRELASNRRSRTDSEIEERNARISTREGTAAEAKRILARAEATLADPNASPDDRRIANSVLMGVKPSVSVTEDKPIRMVPIMRTNPRTGKVEQIGETQSDAKMVQEPAPPSNMSATGGSGQQALAQMIADYRVPPPSARALVTPEGQALMAAVSAINPKYRGETFAGRQRMRVAFTSGPQAQTLNALNTAIEHLDQFVDASKALDNGSFRPGNQAFNNLRAAFGANTPTDFQGIKTILAGELAAAFKRTGATDIEIAQVTQSLNDTNSTAQLISYAKNIAIPALASKANTFQRQYRDTMGDEDDWSAINDTARGVLQKHGFDPDHPTMSMGGAGTPASRYTVGQSIKLKDGRTVTVTGINPTTGKPIVQ